MLSTLQQCVQILQCIVVHLMVQKLFLKMHLLSIKSSLWERPPSVPFLTFFLRNLTAKQAGLASMGSLSSSCPDLRKMAFFNLTQFEVNLWCLLSYDARICYWSYHNCDLMVRWRIHLYKLVQYVFTDYAMHCIALWCARSYLHPGSDQCPIWSRHIFDLMGSSR